MKVFIVTSNYHKEKELSRYFKNIGIKTTHLLKMKDVYINDLFDEKNNHIIFVSEQTKLINKETKKFADLNSFQSVIHKSTVFIKSVRKESNGETISKKEKYTASVDGLLFPDLKTDREDIYNWDDIFVSEKSMISYQDMKDRGLKNSARDLAFSLCINDMSYLFKFDNKVNLNFNKSEVDEVISFEPFIENLLENNNYYKICNKNEFFRNILSHIISQGIFVRRAADKSQRNYWLPGLNAGIPLTPKKDDIHEATFMFHDIMHFIYPDLIVTENNQQSKHIYIISRMMSEAFTIILADMFFISLLKKENIDYDFDKRKIYPLFKNSFFDISYENIDLIKDILWANTCFALLGEESLLKAFVKDEKALLDYKEKYQRFFQEDYKWTERNYENISKSSHLSKKWYEDVKENIPDLIQSTHDYMPDFNINNSLREQVKCVFNKMFSKIEMFSKSYCNEYKNDAFKRYMLGQINIFYKYDTVYNKLFIKTIFNLLSKEVIDKDKVIEVYNLYLEKLVSLNLITSYEEERYKHIFPVFDPFYVFYESKREESFDETLNNIFGDENV